MPRFTSISGVHTPANLVTHLNSNYVQTDADLTNLEAKTSDISGTAVGTNSVQDLKNKTIITNNVNNTTGNVLTINREDFNTNSEIYRWQTHYVDPQTGSGTTGIIQNLYVDGVEMPYMIISGGNGIKTSVYNNELRVDMDTNVEFNASGQSFLFGAQALKTGFDYDVSGKSLFRDGLSISNLTSPTASQENVVLVESSNGHAALDLRSHTASDANLAFREQTTAKYVLGKTQANDFQFYDYDKTNRVFVVDNSRSGHIAFHTGASADADATYPFWVNSNSKITGNLDVSGDITTGTFEGTIGDNKVTTVSIIDDNVTAAKIADDVAGPGLIPNGGALQVNTDESTVELNGDVVRVKAGGITTNELGTDSVDSDEITDGSIDTSHLSADCITEAKIANDQVKKEHLNPDVCGDGITQGSGGILETDPDGTTLQNSGGKIIIKAAGVDTAQLKNDAVTSTKILDNTITAANIAADAVGTSELANNAVGTANIIDDAVTSAKLGPGAVDGSALASTISGNKTLPGNINFTGQLKQGGNRILAGGQVPIGTIVAWIGGWSSFNNTLTSANCGYMQSGAWKLCNGTTVSDADSPVNGGTLPNLNGSSESTRRFLRGNSSAGGSGNTYSHNHNANDNSHGDANGIPRWGNANTDNQAHVPPFFNVKYIVRVK